MAQVPTQGRKIYICNRCHMDAAAVLALLPQEGARRAFGRRREAPEPLAAGAPRDAMDVLNLLNPKSKRKKQKLHFRSKHVADKRRRSAAAKSLEVKMKRFNKSGRAVTADMLMHRDQARCPGKGKWKKWQSSAVIHAAFSKGSLRQIAKSIAVWGKRSPASVAHSRGVVAQAICEGQKKGVQRLRDQSFTEPLKFTITGHVFDETKLWYTIPGMGYRKFSTLCHHTQISWKTARDQVFDEDLIRKPKALTGYTASVQTNALTQDDSTGLLPLAGARPWARFHGTVTMSDSHGVNWLTLRYARVTMDAAELMLPGACLQHHVGNTATSVTRYLNIFTRVWTLSKTFSEGDFHQSLVEHMDAVLADEAEGLEVVDPEIFSLESNDLGTDFTQTIMERCYQHGLGPGEGAPEDATKKRDEVRAEFCKFFPYGWNRRRPLHPCPAGCCGPTACHDRQVSLGRARGLIRRVILKRITEPAQNKWTKMDPAMCQAALVTCFFQLVQQSLEAKLGISYGELVALGPEDPDPDPDPDKDQAQADQESWKGALKRYGKRCLAFVGAEDSRMLNLVWIVVGGPLMVLHYRFFKHCSWYSHADGGDDERCGAIDFCPGPACEIKENPASKALTGLAIMLFDPNGQGKTLVQPLLSMFGGTVHWPMQVLRVYQKSLLTAFGKVWRQLVHRFLCYPWAASCIFDPAVALESRKAAAQAFWNAVEIDKWIGEPLRQCLCERWEDLLEDDLQDFVHTMFTRCMAVSTYAEKLFSPLTQWTTNPRSRPQLTSLCSQHVNTVFDQNVQRWWRTLSAAAEGRSGRCRDPATYPLPVNSKMCGWHLYVRGAAAGKHGREAIDAVNRKRKEYDGLRPEDRERWEQDAKQDRTRARARGSPLDKELRELIQWKGLGGPWGLAAQPHRPNEGDNMPLDPFVIEELLDQCTLDDAAKAWQKATTGVVGKLAGFPTTVSLEEPCKFGECIHGLRPAQQHRLELIRDTLRLALRHSGLPSDCHLCFSLVCGEETRYCIVADHDWTHKLRCDVVLCAPMARTSVPFELRIQKENVGTVKGGWPVIQSEQRFLLSLVTHSSDPWHIYALRADPEQTWSVNVLDKVRLDAEEMRSLEAERLERMHALKLLKKMTEAAAKPAGARKGRGKGRRKGRGKARGKARGKGDDHGDTVFDQESDTASEPGSPGELPSSSDWDSDADPPEADPPPPPLRPPPSPLPAEVVEEVPPPPPAPAEGLPRRARVGTIYGSGEWKLAPYRPGGVVLGVGAICNMHWDADAPHRVCKKVSTIGRSGLSYDEMQLRMKRWLVSGLDDDEWEEESKRTKHINLGGKHLRDFAMGLSEEQCDRIANSQ